MLNIIFSRNLNRQPEVIADDECLDYQMEWIDKFKSVVNPQFR